MPHTIVIVLQIIIALGLLNVWCLRPNRATGFRGGDAKNIKEEFAVYGLSERFCYLVGFLKISCALLLLAGLWYAPLGLLSAMIIVVLMMGAVAMHAKVGDPLVRSVPAAVMLLMSVIVFTGLLP